VIPDDSPAFSFLTPAAQAKPFAYTHLQTEYDVAIFCAHSNALMCNGYSLLRTSILKTVPGGQTLPITRRDVDNLFAHYKSAAMKATWKFCEDGPTMNESIHHENVGNCQRLGHYDTNQGLEHLRVAHPGVYKLKLYLDVATAFLSDDLGIKTYPTATYQIPRTGGCMLVTYPGCRAQKPHTDFKPRFFSAMGNFLLPHTRRTLPFSLR
jgi:hypothetical protein